MPFEQPLGQLTAAPHWPFAPHVCTPLPIHWVAPGEHTAPLSEEPSAVVFSLSSKPPPVASVVESGTVESALPPLPLLLLPLLPPLPLSEGAPSAEASRPMVVVLMLPPQELTRAPATATAKAHGIQRLQSIIGRPQGSSEGWTPPDQAVTACQKCGSSREGLSATPQSRPPPLRGSAQHECRATSM
jgi:hypothetical protein